jgi:hypothetical protein
VRSVEPVDFWSPWAVRTRSWLRCGSKMLPARQGKVPLASIRKQPAGLYRFQAGAFEVFGEIRAAGRRAGEQRVLPRATEPRGRRSPALIANQAGGLA